MDVSLKAVIRDYIKPAYALLPAAMESEKATVMLLTTGQQESKFEDTHQIVAGKPGVKGPARGYWQFELGTAASRGGVWGVFLHEASRYWLKQLCDARGVAFAPTTIWRALETDHVLAAGVARLLLFTDPKPLPEIGDSEAAWKLYAKRTWRPGKPHRETWDAYYDNAMRAAA